MTNAISVINDIFLLIISHKILISSTITCYTRSIRKEWCTSKTLLSWQIVSCSYSRDVTEGECICNLFLNTHLKLHFEIFGTFDAFFKVFDHKFIIILVQVSMANIDVCNFSIVPYYHIAFIYSNSTTMHEP